MKISKLIFVLVFGLLALPGASFAGSPCRGDVPIPGSYTVERTIYWDTKNEGDSLALSSPVTQDALQIIHLTIQKVIKTSDGQRFIATYDQTEGNGFVAFESRQLPTGETVLSDFKGFEAGIPFGPAVLTCGP